MTLTTASIALSEPVNLRDLGGLPVDGGTMRAGVAIRADDLAIITPAYAEALVADGLAAVIDLRSPEEVGFTGRGPLAGHTVAYHHVPFIASLGAAMTDASDWRDPANFGHSYAGMIEAMAGSIVAALAIIAYSPGAVAFHCAAGKDRTGVLAASLLLALGASDETVSADYAATEPNIGRIHERTRETVGELISRMGIELDLNAVAAAKGGFGADAMQDAITILRERHGDPLAPLRSAGLTDALVQALRIRAVDA